MFILILIGYLFRSFPLLLLLHKFQDLFHKVLRIFGRNKMPAPLHNTRFDIAIHLTCHLQRTCRPKNMLSIQNHRPNLHLPILLQPLSILLRIRFEHPVNFKRTSQRARHRILHRVEIHVLVRECVRVLGEPAVEIFQVHLLSAGYEGDGDVGLSLEVPVPEGRTVFVIFVELRAGEQTLAPYHAGDVGGELGNVGVGDHSSNVGSDDVYWLLDAHVLRHQFVEVLSEHGFGVAIRWAGRVSSATVIGSDDPVAGFCERNGDVPELVACLREAVDEEYGTLGLASGGKAFDVVDSDLRVRLLEPDLAMAGNGSVLGCHCRG